MTTFIRLTLDWMIGALWREISFWQCLRGLDAACAIMRIPWNALCTWIPAQPKGMSRGKSGIQNLAMIYCSRLIIKPANKRAVALSFSSMQPYKTSAKSQWLHKSSTLSWPTCAWQLPLLGFINYPCYIKYKIISATFDDAHSSTGTIECFVSELPPQHTLRSS